MSAIIHGKNLDKAPLIFHKGSGLYHNIKDDVECFGATFQCCSTGLSAAVQSCPSKPTKDTNVGQTDGVPLYFSRSPSKCIDMLVGIVDRGHDAGNRSIKVAFAGRKRAGRWLLRLLPRKFRAQRAAPNLYHVLGRRATARELEVPSLEEARTFVAYVIPREEAIIADCLDHLPWSALAGSIHRGLKDMGESYAQPYLAAYREPLTRTLAKAISEH
ncbi:MAG: hypothetical protein Q9186_005703 [Xanthomendoza sp. 1 TL-2023]